jgi:hypothetical protein
VAKDSDHLVNEGFRKEFKAVLRKIDPKQAEKELEERELDFEEVGEIMKRMGFLQAKMSKEQED